MYEIVDFDLSATVCEEEEEEEEEEKKEKDAPNMFQFGAPRSDSKDTPITFTFGAPAAPPAAASPAAASVESLLEMGFGPKAAVVSALTKAKGSIEAAIQILSSSDENQSSSSGSGGSGEKKEEIETWTLRSSNVAGWRVRSLPDMSQDDNEVDTKHNGDHVQVVRTHAGPNGKWLELANGVGFTL